MGYSHLSYVERLKIADGKREGLSLRALCADLNDGVVRIQQPFDKRGDGI